jgi:hypothetical protein
VVCTGEAELQSALNTIPSEWKDRVAMMQNELLPRDWAIHDFIDPTVISVWFEKKKGMDSKVLISSPVFGPKAFDTLHIKFGCWLCKSSTVASFSINRPAILVVRI